MNRRHFLTTTAAAAFALAARAEDQPKMRVAVIGHSGRGNYGHGLDTMWLAVPGAEIVAVADADAKGLAGALKQTKTERGFADYRKMLAEVKPDIVSVAPRFLDEHRDMILAAAEAGARGVYCEKPYVRTPAEADEVAAACAKHGMKIAVAHRNRWHPVLPVITQLVKDGAIGRLLEIRARGKEDARGGALDLWVLGSHLLNLVHYFAGRPLACSGVLLKNGNPAAKADITEGAEGTGPLAGNEVHARYEMENGCPAFFDSIQNAGTAAAGFGVQLVGTEGVIDLRIDKEPLAHIMKGSPFNPTKAPREWVTVTSGGIGRPEPAADIKALVAGHVGPALDLIAAIREGREPLCSAADGAMTVEMICAVFESHRLGGARVALPLKTRVNPLTLL